MPFLKESDTSYRISSFLNSFSSFASIISRFLSSDWLILSDMWSSLLLIISNAFFILFIESFSGRISIWLFFSVQSLWQSIPFVHLFYSWVHWTAFPNFWSTVIFFVWYSITVLHVVKGHWFCADAFEVVNIFLLCLKLVCVSLVPRLFFSFFKENYLFSQIFMLLQILFPYRLLQNIE